MPKSVLGKAIRLGAISTQFSPHPSRLGFALIVLNNYDSINVTHNFDHTRDSFRIHLETINRRRSDEVGTGRYFIGIQVLFFSREQNTVKFRNSTRDNVGENGSGKETTYQKEQ